PAPGLADENQPDTLPPMQNPGAQGGASPESGSDSMDSVSDDFSNQRPANLTGMGGMGGMNMTSMGEDDSDMSLQVAQKISMTNDGTQRLELNVTYGNNTITQIFEVRDGELEQLPDMEAPFGANATVARNMTVGGNMMDMEEMDGADMDVMDAGSLEGMGTTQQESSGGEPSQDENMPAMANGAGGPAGPAGSRVGPVTPRISSGVGSPQDANDVASGDGAQGQAGSPRLRMKSRRSMRRG
ncbi:MAG: hypothetical protein Q9183_005017, partial [Haloplaca sp. 2 TL-2023]